MGQAGPPTIESIFGAALELTGAQRERYLHEACGADAPLRQRIEALLRAHESAAGFLSQPAAGEVAAGPSAGDGALAAAEAPGTRIGPYRLLQLIGEGGFGSVFLAEQEQPVRRRVALKVIKLGMDTRQVIGRFEAERQALAMMDHPNIARVFDAGATAAGRPYFVMELVGGERITDYCDKNSLGIADRLALFTQVCEAVQHAHTKGVIHRDIKPSNILVAAQDGRPAAKVIDFGIAKAAGQPLTDKTIFTEHRALIGTPQYMSPEQAEGSLDIDTRTDVYSLGVVLYELLTGTTPFTPETLRSASHEIPRMIRELEPPRPSTRLATMSAARAKDEPAPEEIARRRRSDTASLRKALRADLDWIAMKALEKDRSRRYETASALALDIARHTRGEPVSAAPPSTTYRLRKFIRRHRLGVAAGALVALALVLGVIGTSAGMLWALREQERARDAARSEGNQKQIALLNAQKARAEAQAASKARDEAEQIAAFMSTTLQGAGPSVTLGRDATMLREMMDGAASRIESGELRASPGAELRLRVDIGETYMQLSQYERARAMLEPAVELARTLHGDGLDEVAIAAFNNFAVLLQARGDFAGAEPFFRAALDTNRRLHPGDDPYVAAALSNLAGLLQDLADFDDAEPLMREAVEMWERLNPGDHNDTATGLSNLASLRSARGDYAGAEALYRRSLEMRRRLFPGDHPDIALDLNNLGEAILRRGDHDGAEPLLRESLAMRRRLYPGDSAAVATAANNLATLLRMRADLDAAEPLYREALDMDRRLFPGDHPVIASDLRGLAALLRDRGDHAAAESTIREALEMLQRLFFGDHPEVAEGLRALGVVLHGRADTSGAETCLRDSLAMWRRLFPGDHPQIAGVLGSLGNLLRGRPDPAAAAPVLEEALAMQRRLAPEALPDAALTDLAEVYEEAGRPAEAEPLWRELLGAREESLPAPDWRTALARSRLGNCLALQRRFAEAEPLLIEGFRALTAALDAPRSPTDRVREACRRVVSLYESWDAADRAAGGPGKAEALAAWRSELESLPRPAK